MSNSSYYMVIPASVWDDKNLSPAAKWIYGRISTLTKKCGYCFAGNKWLANELQASPRTVQRYLVELKNAGHIRIEVEGALGNERKIWLNVLPPTTNLSPPHDKFVMTPSRQICHAEEERVLIEKEEGSTPTPLSKFLDILRADPYFEGLDIDAEYERAVQWCEKKERALTQRFFRDWLGRADRPDLVDDAEDVTEAVADEWTKERIQALLQLYPGAVMPPRPWNTIPLDVQCKVEEKVRLNQANEKKAGGGNAYAHANGRNGALSGESAVEKAAGADQPGPAAVVLGTVQEIVQEDLPK